jgi:D-3-phosphoglycerate dehydrogenase
MTSARTLLVAPHQFPDLEREAALAAEFGLSLVAAPDKAAFRDGMADAAIVMVTPYGRVEAEDFARLSGCLAVVRYGMGYDNIDVRAGVSAGVPVSIVPGTASEEVGSHALALGMALARRVPAGQAAIAAGGWAGKVGFDAPRISDLTVGVVGLGRIGALVARWWAALGADVVGYDPYAQLDGIRSAELDEVLTGSDLVSLHLPLMESTRHVVSADLIARMRPGAVVVNVSRGGLIDEAALASALTSGHLAGAGLDVFSEEPLPADHPLRSTPNTILTPHVAWRSDVSLDALQEGAVARARAALEGRPIPDLVTE